MLKLSIRSLLAHKIRYGLTALAVLLGVSFVVASFVLADSLRKVFEGVGADIASPVDVLVRSADPFDREATIDRVLPPVPESLLDTVAAMEGVERVSGDLTQFVSISTPDGEVIKPVGGAPVIGINWDGPEASVSAISLVDGAIPTDDQMGVDVDTAKQYDLAVGDVLTVRTLAGPEEFPVGGIIRFGENNGGGAIYGTFTTPTAQRLFGLTGQFDSLSVDGVDGRSQGELRNLVAEQLPEGFDAITGEQLGDEFSNSFNQIIGIIRNALLGFAGVSLFVSIFIIANTFSIVIGQRTRELGMLRAIGAGRAQVFRSVVIEALLIGLVGSVIGAVAGLGVAKLIVLLLESQGGAFPTVGLVLSPATWILAVVVGLIVTLLAAVFPAWRAGRISPVAAMREGALTGTGRMNRRRLFGGVVLAVLGIGLLAWGLVASPEGTAPLLTSLIFGALAIFLAVAALSPLIAGPAVNVIGNRPFGAVVIVLGVLCMLTIVLLPIGLALFKTGRAGMQLPGRLGRGNAARNPGRTSTTAAALMIGLALVAMASVVGESFKKSFVDQLSSSIEADLFLSPDQFFPFSPEAVKEIVALDEIDKAAGVRQGRMQVRDATGAFVTKTVSSVPPDSIEAIVAVTFLEGGFENLDDDGLAINEDVAEDLGVSVGDTVAVRFIQTGEKSLTVRGIYDSKTLANLGNWMIGQGVYEANFGEREQLDFFAGATVADGVDPKKALTAVEGVLERYPEIKVEDRTAFQKTQEDQLNQLLFIINALLVFSLIIALLGIANTMALSVFERTRELGLLRAVGASRTQVRGMIRWESIVVATFGAALGLILGVVFGIAIVSALPSSVVTTMAIPIRTLVILVVVAIIAGLLAALLPARRAARLNVLDAIAEA